MMATDSDAHPHGEAIRAQARGHGPGPVTILCDWLPPDFGAVGQYLLLRARETAAAGHDVVLVGLSRQGVRERDERIGGGQLVIHAIDAQQSPKDGLLKRGLWALNMNARLLLATGRALKTRPGGDILVTGSPPFLSTLAILLNATIWRRRLIYRITDFYPETVLAAGRASWLRWLKPLFKAVRKRADVIEILGEDQRRRLVADGVDESRIRLARDEAPVPIDPKGPSLPRPFEPGRIVLLYSGNLGIAHPIDVFCEAYRRHIQEGPNRVRLWMNGTGARVRELIAFCEANDLPLQVTPPVALADLPALMVTPDAHMILLGDRFWGYVLPSKVYGCLASGKPVLFVGPEQSDVALLMAKDGNPLHRRVGTVEDCEAALATLTALSEESR